MKRKYFNIIYLVLILLACILFSEDGINAIKKIINHRSYDYVVAIDAGHGGFDPGKVGINKALEKDINLKIAYKLKNYLEQNDIKVVMTRKDGNGLYKKTDHNKKYIDMSKRVSIINSSDASIAISIHQNSFEQQSIKGAQVFYHKNSEEGKILAEIIQETVKRTINDGNHRIAKPNTTYFMLKQTRCPLVIVECGFLSNWEEANLLCEDAYQDKMARAICFGIMNYINVYRKESKAPLV